MKESILKEKSLDFAIRIVKLYKHLSNNRQETTMSKQILRSGTSIGANISEAVFSESNVDFIHKYSISQKECSETMFWLCVLLKTEYLTEAEYDSIHKDCLEIMKLLTSTIVTLKKKHKQPINN